jgi:myo-inositol-1(or 4)-monophosphatase
LIPNPIILEPIIRSAGSIALSYFQNLRRLHITKKSPRDFVTEADIAVETFLIQELSKHFPEYGFWCEESGLSENQNQRWIIDPIDGTHSFYKGQYFWSISVALEIDGIMTLGMVYAPALNDLYVAEKNRGACKNGEIIHVSEEKFLADTMVSTGFACVRAHAKDNNLQRFCRIAEQTMGQRRFGSVALDLCMVADGQVDAFWEQHLNLYDIAAGALISQEAGATLSDFAGNLGVFPQQILAANHSIHQQILPFM